MGRLAGKVAIITGASQGMGAATARLFAAEGAKVVLGDVLTDKGAAVAAELGDSAVFSSLDVRDESDWAGIATLALDRFGGIDILVNNAGVMHWGAIETLSIPAR
ncbi:SDR family NAD(P)-dependent oxidoreductase [Nocardia tengchongensis]|uniref:SDR family NAD(P)-dependent oxidoreductase n=1 Tax=Nocardia tengchongensis TaxID=2055889 RepID=UPI00367C0950